MNYQWYPGHMTKAKRMMQENIGLIDLVIELVDARIPFSSRNPDIDELGKNKSRIILLNKSDLADASANRLWMDYFMQKGFHVLEVNARSGQGLKSIHALVREACKDKIERDRKRGIKNRPIRAIVVGIPNVGKSTFINSFAGKACTKTGNKPGVTKGKQWIRMNKELELLDTPGILWPKFESKEVGRNLALIGSMNDEILEMTELAGDLIAYLLMHYREQLSDRYQMDEPDDMTTPLTVLTHICENRKCYKKGQEADYEKASSIVMEDFRSGRIGRITLELPGDTESVRITDGIEEITE
ncbi:MAG: ribosome biogenesis GTPase YlqF [Lachnospiraceae bacterium]|nr:ribosome biogenesis GTPase YlqF [Lachnospiraceae bacterium]